MPLHCCQTHGTLAYNVRCVYSGKERHLRRAFIAAFAAHQWTSAVLDGRCIHEFIMPSSRTESAYFSQNRPNPSTYEILRTVTTLVLIMELSVGLM